MKSLYTVGLWIILGYCYAQPSITPIFKPQQCDTKSIFSFNYSPSPDFTDSIFSVHCTLSYDSILNYIVYDLANLPNKDSSFIIQLDKSIYKNSLTKAQSPNTANVNPTYLSKGLYTLTYLIQGWRDTFIISYHFFIKDNNVNVNFDLQPRVDIQLNANYGFNSGQPQANLNRDLHLLATTGTEFFKFPISFQFLLSTNYKNIEVSNMPVFVGLDIDNIKKDLENKAKDKINELLGSDRMDMKKISALQFRVGELKKVINNPQEQSNLKKGKEYLNILKTLKDSITNYKGSSAALDSLRVRFGNFYNDYCFDSIGLDSVIKSKFTNLNLETYQVKAAIEGNDSIKTKFGLLLDSLKKLQNYIGYSKVFEKAESDIANYTGNIDTIRNRPLKIAQKLKDKKFDDPQEVMDFIQKSPYFTKIQKIIYRIKDLKLGAFSPKEESIFLQNSHLIGGCFESDFKGIYTYGLIGLQPHQKKWSLATNPFTSERTIYAAGIGYQRSSDNYIHFLFKYGVSGKAGDQSSIQGSNAVFGFASKASLIKNKLQLICNVFSSATAANSSSLVAQLPYDRNVIVSAFTLKTSNPNLKSGIGVYSQVNFVPSQVFSINYQVVYLAPGYQSFGYELYAKRMFHQDIKINISPLRNMSMSFLYRYDKPNAGSSALHVITNNIKYCPKVIIMNFSSIVSLLGNKINTVNTSFVLQKTFSTNRITWNVSLNQSYNLSKNLWRTTHINTVNIGVISKYGKSWSTSLNYVLRINSSEQDKIQHLFTPAIRYNYKEKVAISINGLCMLNRNFNKYGISSDITMLINKYINISLRIENNYGNSVENLISKYWDVLLYSRLQITL